MEKKSKNRWLGMEVNYNEETSMFSVTNTENGKTTSIPYCSFFINNSSFLSFNDFSVYLKEIQEISPDIDSVFSHEAITVIDDILKHNKRMLLSFQSKQPEAIKANLDNTPEEDTL